MKTYITPEFSIDKEHLDLFIQFLEQDEEHEMYVSGSGGCVDTETEYLTVNGWVPIDKYSGEQIAVVQVDNEKPIVQFELPTDYIVNRGKHKAYKFYDKERRSTINMVLTPDHRLPYYTSKHNIAIDTADNIVNTIYAKKVRGNSRNKFYGAGKGIPTGFSYRTDEELSLSNDEISYMLAVQADAHILVSRGAVLFNFKKSRKIERLTGILDRLGYYYTVATYDTGYTRFYVKGDVDLETKDITRLYKASYKQMVHVAKEIVYWDGSLDPRTGRAIYSSNNKKNVDCIQFILTATSGTSTSISKDDRHERGSKSAVSMGYCANNTTQNKKTIEYAYISEIEIENNYCFTTRSSLWLARRGDFIFVTGNSGKTTQLIHYIQFMVRNDIPFLLGAYTHAACEILRQKIYIEPEGSEATSSIRTIHSFLKKSPGVNSNAIDIRRVQVTNRRGKAEPPKVILFDEYSMIGEEDYMDIGELCADESGNILVKTVYVGDPMQLPPVKSARTVYPRGDFQLVLEVNHRASSNCLVSVLDTLRKMKDTGQVTRLPECDQVRRKVDIVQEFVSRVSDKQNNKLLAYTNMEVDRLNRAVMVALRPNKNPNELEVGDNIFVDTHKMYTRYKDADMFSAEADKQIAIQSNSQQVLTRDNDTYNSIDYLLRQDYEWLVLPDGRLKAFVFGNMAYKDLEQALITAAVTSNKTILKTAGISDSALKEYKNKNYSIPLVIENKQLWREYMTFKNYVTLVNRPFASTVHKVQGVTLDNVFISGPDLLKLYDMDVGEYLSLFYTALSRAKHNVFISN